MTLGLLLKIARTVTGSVAEIIAPKNRQSVKEKKDLMEPNIEMIVYMKPPMKKQETVVPKNAYARIAPKFLKK